MLKIALCDDNVAILDNIYSVIRDFLENNSHSFIVDKYTNGELLRKLQPKKLRHCFFRY